MNRSMMVSVGVLVVLGVIVAVNILSDDDSGSVPSAADGGNLLALEQAARISAARADSPPSEPGSIPVIPPEKQPQIGPGASGESLKPATQPGPTAVASAARAAIARTAAVSSVRPP